MSVSINPPKTPVTEGSNGVASATVPNVCKMPGPPAPFVPTPLPNIGKSDKSPKGYSTKVEIEGNKVAIKGATFRSMGDVASKGTGGGLISANVEGPTSFVGPGSLDVKIEGKNVQLLGDPMLNNCGPSGNPPNAATLMGVIQKTGDKVAVTAVEAGKCPLCNEHHGPLKESKASKADAGTLAKNYKQALGNQLKATPPTMLGVVHCRCKRKYADQSGITRKALGTAADASGMKHPTIIEGITPEATQAEIKRRMAEHLGNSYKFHKTWQKAQARARRSLEGLGPTSYTPGHCAAQKALVLMLADGGLADAMTEEWFSGEEKPTASAVTFIESRRGKRKKLARPFRHGETVPPCGTCELIVPLLLCPQEKASCSH